MEILKMCNVNELPSLIKPKYVTVIPKWIAPEWIHSTAKTSVAVRPPWNQPEKVPDVNLDSNKIILLNNTRIFIWAQHLKS